MPIQQNMALYSLIEVTYGGDGVNYFNLPDLRGRFPIGVDARQPAYNALGKVGGATSSTFAANSTGALTLQANNLPGHTHTFTGTAATVNLVLGPAKTAGLPGANCNIYKPQSATPANNISLLNGTLSGTAPVTGSVTVTPAGTVASTATAQPAAFSASGSGACATMPPFIAMNFIICVQKGLYPDCP